MFAKNMRYLRQKRKLTQKDISDRLGYKAYATVNKWEMQEATPPYKKILEIANLFGVAPDDLMNIDLEKQEQENLKNIKNISKPAVHPLPILGTICAGNGTLCEQSYDGYFYVDNSIRADLCLTIRGDSMQDAGIYDNDKAFIRQNCSYENGNIYAVLLKDEELATLKRVYWNKENNGEVVLLPCNEAFPPIVAKESDIYILGECVGVYHDLKEE